MEKNTRDVTSMRSYRPVFIEEFLWDASLWTKHIKSVRRDNKTINHEWTSSKKNMTPTTSTIHVVKNQSTQTLFNKMQLNTPVLRPWRDKNHPDPLHSLKEIPTKSNKISAAEKRGVIWIRTKFISSGRSSSPITSQRRHGWMAKWKKTSTLDTLQLRDQLI